jgi:alginate export protein
MSRRAMLLSLLCAATCLGQAPPPSGPEPIKLGDVIVTGTFRERGEVWSWFQPTSGDERYAFSGSILRLSLSQTKGRMDWNIEIAAPFVLGLPPRPVGPGAQGALGLGGNYFNANDQKRNTIMAFPKQAFIRFSKLGPGEANALKLGRFEFADGGEVAPANASIAALKRDRINQRLIGNFTFAHVGRSFDGVQYSYSKPSGSFTFVGAVPTRGVFQLDGWGWHKIAFGYGSYIRPWNAARKSGEARLLAMYYNDWRGILKTDNRPVAVRRADQANIRIGTFGGHVVENFQIRNGSVDWLLWAVAQTGRWGVQDHGAYAVDVEAGVQPDTLPKLKPWLRAGFYRGSGDGDPGDNRHETFFQLLPSPRPFARIPFFNLMNNQDAFAMLLLRPHPKVTLSSEAHTLKINKANDLWYSGGGAFQPWTFGYTGRDSGLSRSLANLYDTSAEYRFSPRATFTGYLGYVQARGAVHATYPGAIGAAFGYAEMLYRF